MTHVLEPCREASCLLTQHHLQSYILQHRRTKSVLLLYTHFGDFTSSQCSLTFWRDECVCYLCDVAVTVSSLCDVGGVTVSLCDVGGVTVWQSHCVMLVVWQCDSLLQWSHNVYTQCGPGRPGTLRPPLICVSGAVTGSSEGCPCTHSDTPPHYPHTPPCRGSSPSPTSSGRPRRTLPVLPPPPLWTGSRSAGRQ